jgi:SrtB family sortase
MGSHNSAGAIFMDYRNTNNFDEHVSILYGHYTRDGSMFTALSRYLDAAFLQQNPNVTVTTRDGRSMTFRIFAAKLTDAWDIAYTVALRDPARAAEEFPNAPAEASRFMLLSTCTRSADDNERILVFAAAS